MIAHLILGLALAAPAGSFSAEPAEPAPVLTLAQYEATPQGYRGTGGNFGRGWERGRSGSVTGTGGNFGGGFESNPKRKSFTGTGNRFGGGYDVQSGGRRIVGTGNNFGKGWERQGNEWVGTGGNFGKRCPATRGSNFVPCM